MLFETSTKVIYTYELAIILENIENKAAGTYAAFNNAGYIDGRRFTVNPLYAGKKNSMLFDWFYKQQLADYYGNYENNKALLAELKAMVAQIAADFDAANAAVEVANAKTLADWTKANEAYVAFMTELTGKKDGTIVYKLDSTTTPTSKIYVAHSNGSYILKGSQLTWANELAPAYPAKVKEWADRTAHLDELTNVHLATLKKALNDAYLAAANLEWKLTAAELAAVGNDYSKAYQYYVQSIKTFFNVRIAAAEDAVADATSALERYKAGYDGKALAIQVAENALAKAEAELAIAEKELELAKAEMDAVIAKYIG